MGWEIGFDDDWKRDIGYGVPATCDHPECTEKIDRGLSYVCGGEPYGGDHGCGLYFCYKHHPWYGKHEDAHSLCERCHKGKPPFEPKPEHLEWIHHKATDRSWAKWRAQQEPS